MFWDAIKIGSFSSFNSSLPSQWCLSGQTCNLSLPTFSKNSQLYECEVLHGRWKYIYKIPAIQRYTPFFSTFICIDFSPLLKILVDVPLNNRPIFPRLIPCNTTIIFPFRIFNKFIFDSSVMKIIEDQIICENSFQDIQPLYFKNSLLGIVTNTFVNFSGSIKNCKNMKHEYFDFEYFICSGQIVVPIKAHNEWYCYISPCFIENLSVSFGSSVNFLSIEKSIEVFPEKNFVFMNFSEIFGDKFIELSVTSQNFLIGKIKYFGSFKTIRCLPGLDSLHSCNLPSLPPFKNLFLSLDNSCEDKIDFAFEQSNSWKSFLVFTDVRFICLEKTNQLNFIQVAKISFNFSSIQKCENYFECKFPMFPYTTFLFSGPECPHECHNCASVKNGIINPPAAGFGIFLLCPLNILVEIPFLARKWLQNIFLLYF